MELTADSLKHRAKIILGSVNFGIFVGEDKSLKTLQRIIDDEIHKNELELLSRTLDIIDNLLSLKNQMILSKHDHEYLTNLARALRNQQVRIEDQTPFSSPIFKVSIDENDKEKNFSFITREGAAKYIEYNKSILKHLPVSDTATECEEGTDRRKNDYIGVDSNRNLEIERIIEIIKRNF